MRYAAFLCNTIRIHRGAQTPPLSWVDAAEFCMGMQTLYLPKWVEYLSVLDVFDFSVDPGGTKVFEVIPGKDVDVFNIVVSIRVSRDMLFIFLIDLH